MKKCLVIIGILTFYFVATTESNAQFENRPSIHANKERKEIIKVRAKDLVLAKKEGKTVYFIGEAILTKNTEGLIVEIVLPYTPEHTLHPLIPKVYQYGLPIVVTEYPNGRPQGGAMIFDNPLARTAGLIGESYDIAFEKNKIHLKLDTGKIFSWEILSK